MPKDRDNTEIRQLVMSCNGNIAEIGRKLDITRQAASLRVEAAGLSAEAAALRAMHGGRGPRPALAGGSINPAAEAKRITEALAKHGTQEAAAKALGIGRSRLQRAIQRLGIVVPA